MLRLFSHFNYFITSFTGGQHLTCLYVVDIKGIVDRLAVFSRSLKNHLFFAEFTSGCLDELSLLSGLDNDFSWLYVAFLINYDRFTVNSTSKSHDRLIKLSWFTNSKSHTDFRGKPTYLLINLGEAFLKHLHLGLSDATKMWLDFLSTHSFVALNNHVITLNSNFVRTVLEATFGEFEDCCELLTDQLWVLLKQL
jgi:hypothetical protein